jgi:hypothetical protein
MQVISDKLAWDSYANKTTMLESSIPPATGGLLISPHFLAIERPAFRRARGQQSQRASGEQG